MSLFGKKLTEKEATLRNWFRDQGDQTLRLRYPLNEKSVVIDAGGYEGAWAADIYARYGCEIHIFEPVPGFAESIRRRFFTNPRIHVYEVALGAGEAVSEIFLSKDASSLYSQEGEPIPIQVVDGSQFLEDLDIADIALMKINIEGGEYDLLPNLIDSGYADQTTDLQVQFHDFVPDAEAKVELIRRALSLTHRLTWQYPFVWENWHKL